MLKNVLLTLVILYYKTW